MNSYFLRSRINQIQDTDDIVILFNDIRKEQKSNPFFTKSSLIFFTTARISTFKKYKTFSLPKRSGHGTRTIFSPKPLLNSMQEVAKTILETFYVPKPYVTGFIKKRNITDNALPHIGNKYIFSADLKDFFSQIKGNLIFDILTKPPYSFPEIFANFIVYLCCTDIYETDFYSSTGKHYMLDNMYLPQGACTSPILSNIVCEKMDNEVNKFCKQNGAVYTRYADDITISFCSDSLLTKKKDRLNEVFHNQLLTLVPYHFNKKKTRIRKRGQRLEVTGIIISDEKLNVRRTYIKDLRNLMYIWDRYGKARAERRFLNHYFKSDKERKGIPKIENYIDGKLNYLKMIKGENDPVYLKLLNRFLYLKGV